jgi:transcription elongation factor GreA
MTEEKIFLTREGYEKLVEELNFLQTKKRREVADQLEHARALGDLRENSEYDTAKDAKQHLETRIRALESRLSKARIVDLSELPQDKAYIGATLELKNVATGDVVRYTLVSQDEADFDKGKISVTSPLGKGLLGKAPKEIAEIQVPAGMIRFEVLNITRS